MQFYLNPQAEHLLDWFHLTMRLTVLNQTAKGLPESVGEGEDQYELRTCAIKDLERIKWYLWHGYRNGERIASGFVESAINQVVSKRMVKKQQMGWSQRGAHLLLQIRTRVLDEEWENTFRHWYPDFRSRSQAKKAA